MKARGGKVYQRNVLQSSSAEGGEKGDGVEGMGKIEEQKMKMEEEIRRKRDARV